MGAKLKALVMMQLKDKIDLSFLSSTRKTISKIVLSIVAFAAVTAVIFLLFMVAKLLKVFSLIGTIPSTVVVVVFTIMMLLSIITCTYSLMKNLYFSKDNQVLLTLPASSNMVFASKIIVYYFYELMKNLYFLIPFFVAYGISLSFPIYYYLWLIVCFFVFSALPVSIGALFSILAMYITIFLKNFSLVKWVIFIGIIVAGIQIVVSIINAIPENIDLVKTWGTTYWDIQDFLKKFSEIAFPFKYIVIMIIGTLVGVKRVIFSVTTIEVLAILLALIVACLAISFLITKPLFCKMASKPFEYKKKLTEKDKMNREHKSFLSMINTEVKVLFRNSEDAYSVLSVAIAMPILILLLNKIFLAMSTRLVGDYMIVAFNLLMVLLISLATNGRIASTFSKEGAASYLIKTRPVNYNKSLIAKLIVPAVIMTISIVASILVFKAMNSISVINAILCGFTVEFAYIAHMLWSAEMDIMNPQYAQYATTGTHANNPNETKSTIAMFALSLILALVIFGLCTENAQIAWVKVCLIAFALLAYRIWSFFSKVKYFYKEK